MALTGQLSDLSLTELIEFFCNQRKTGRLKVAYKPAPGFFYFQSGDLVDAKIGVLNGVDAVYYALTLHNASFKFSPSFATTRRTIHQPWTQVALEGLRRLDEGIKPEEAFVDGDLSYLNEPEYADDHADDLVSDELAPEIKSAKKSVPVNPLAQTVEGTAEKSKSKTMVYAAVAAAVVLIVAAVGIPAGWYGKKAAPAAEQEAAQPAPKAEEAQTTAENNNPGDLPSGQTEQTAPEVTAPETNAYDAAALAARREREARERMKAAERANAVAAAKMQDNAATPNPSTDAVKKPEATKPAPKMVSVQVTYDEAGRVTAASGGDSNALRIARQKRFPAGKAGSTTVTIPIN
ncbi:MAG TPA: DUF4388 domain-containing protein [Pyrinomonadaceae bacterium]|jgi:hypothetical protein